MVISCDYCGGSVTLGGGGWKEISKHTMLPLKVTDSAAALKAVQAYVDAGFFHRHDFEESKIVEEKLSFVPFWVVPASASTTYQYQAVATSVGATVGTMAAGAVLGSVLGGRAEDVASRWSRSSTGPVVNPNRSETISGQYEYPVVAVKAMTAYQPKDYEFGLADRSFFDKKGIPAGTPVLNGDLGEDAAQHAAQAYVQTAAVRSGPQEAQHGLSAPHERRGVRGRAPPRPDLVLPARPQGPEVDRPRRRARGPGHPDHSVSFHRNTGV